MNIETFFTHWGIKENPFHAEEARDDTVYHRMMQDGMTHPEFDKIYGSTERPSTAVVFGDKGSGKTAIRLLIEDRMKQHNEAQPQSRIWMVRNDDLNPFIEKIKQATGHDKVTIDCLKEIRLADHMDLLLSRVTTRLADFLLGDDLDFKHAKRIRKELKKLPRQQRLDLAQLVLLYDQPAGDRPAVRWSRIRNQLRMTRILNLRVLKWATWLLLGTTAGLGAASTLTESTSVVLAGCTSGVLLLGALFVATRTALRTRSLAKRLHKEIRVVDRPMAQLKQRLGDLGATDLEGQPLPGKDEDARYELVTRMQRILKTLGHTSMVILYDRIDEPVGVNGDAEKMKAIMWPIFNNKFLQMEGVGFKLLLPLELGHMLKRESAEFYQQARLDKQNMVERLEWSGTTLYDIASKRLASCTNADAKIESLSDLFDDSVSKADLADALEQMHQPRDAFKFLYRIVQEHCQNNSDDDSAWKIPGHVLDHVRKQQSQRVQDLYRGMSPS